MGTLLEILEHGLQGVCSDCSETFQVEAAQIKQRVQEEYRLNQDDPAEVLQYIESFNGWICPSCLIKAAGEDHIPWGGENPTPQLMRSNPKHSIYTNYLNAYISCGGGIDLDPEILTDLLDDKRRLAVALAVEDTTHQKPVRTEGQLIHRIRELLGEDKEDG
jgi:hypothetical protein